MAMPIYYPRTFLASAYQGTLSAGFATAIGATVAHPDKQALSINGDGGFLYNVQEMAKTLPEAFKQPVPMVIEVPFPPTPDPWSVIILRRNRPAA